MSCNHYDIFYLFSTNGGRRDCQEREMHLKWTSIAKIYEIGKFCVRYDSCLNFSKTCVNQVAQNILNYGGQDIIKKTVGKLVEKLDKIKK